ncbi:MAG TPA: hypothetical protein VNN76_01560 [Bacteroidota bacterium]|nr:hypothetical protein [Bacteroidota bacterium]
MKRRIVLVVSVVGLLLVSYSYASACPVCYGQTDSPMADGVNAAILVLMGITGSVLSVFVAFFMYIRKRSKLTLNGQMDVPSVN